MSQIFLIALIILIILLTVLSTLGIETNKFNKLISDKAYQSKSINLELSTISFKLDPKELSLFLETQYPKIIYKDISVPVKNIKIYIDFLSLFKSDPVIKKTNIVLEELDVSELNKLTKIIKPSNFKSLINNKIKKGKLISEVELYLNNEGNLKDFIAKGEIINLKAELLSDLNISKTSLSFFADKNDILIKKISGELEDIKISEGISK